MLTGKLIHSRSPNRLMLGLELSSTTLRCSLLVVKDPTLRDICNSETFQEKWEVDNSKKIGE